MRKPTICEQLYHKYGKLVEDEEGNVLSKITSDDDKLMALVEIWRYYDQARFFKERMGKSLSGGNISNAWLETYKFISESAPWDLPAALPVDLRERIIKNYTIIKEIYDTITSHTEEYMIDKNTPNKKGRKYIRGKLNEIPEPRANNKCDLTPPDWLWEETKPYLV